MPTIVKKALRTAAAWTANQSAMEAVYGAGGYYTLASSWAAALPASLVTADEQHILECYNDWPAGLTDTVTVGSAQVTDATRNIIIRAATGEGHNFSKNSGFWVKSSTNFTRIFSLYGFSHVEDIEADHSANGTAFHLFSAESSVNRVMARSRADSTIRQAILIDTSGGTATNSVAYDSFRGIGSQASENFVGVQVENCLALYCSVYGFRSNGSAGANALIKNCLAIGCAESYNAPANLTVDSGYNAASDGATVTPPGTSPVITNRATSDLVDYVGGDYRTASESALATAGEGGTFIGAALASTGGGYDRSATANITLEDATVSSTAVAHITGSASATLADLTISSTVVVPVLTSSAVTLEDATISATATVESTGNNATANILLDDLTVTSTSAVVIQATGSPQLAPMTLVSTSKVNVQGTASIALEDLTVAATATLLTAPLIEGGASLTINTNGGSLDLYFNGSDYYEVA